MDKALYMRIEKLKKPELVQPYGVLAEEERQILDKAGIGQCLEFDGEIGWGHVKTSRFFSGLSYILKPVYKPKPEYIKISVVKDDGILVLEDAPPNAALTFIDGVSRDHAFDGWFGTMPGNVGYEITNDSQVSRAFRRGNKPYARFVKEG